MGLRINKYELTIAIRFNIKAQTTWALHCCMVHERGFNVLFTIFVWAQSGHAKYTSQLHKLTTNYINIDQYQQALQYYYHANNCFSAAMKITDFKLSIRLSD